MKFKGHQWPTDGVTRKYVDRWADRFLNKLDRVNKRYDALRERIVHLESVVTRYEKEEEE